LYVIWDKDRRARKAYSKARALSKKLVASAKKVEREKLGEMLINLAFNGLAQIQVQAH